MFFIRPPCAVRTAKSSFIFPFWLFFLRRVCYNDRRLVEKVPFCRFAAACFCSLLPLHPARGRRIAVAIPNIAPHTPQGDTDDRPALLHSFVRRSGAAAFLCNFGLFLIFSAIFPTAGVSAGFFIKYGLFSTRSFTKKAVEISLFPAFFFVGSRAIMGTNLFKPVFRIFPCYFARRR